MKNTISKGKNQCQQKSHSSLQQIFNPVTKDVMNILCSQYKEKGKKKKKEDRMIKDRKLKTGIK